MKDVDALPGFCLKYEEGEYYQFISLHLDGESYNVRLPLGDGRYAAQVMVEKIVLPAIASSPLERWKAENGEAMAPVDFDPN